MPLRTAFHRPQVQQHHEYHCCGRGTTRITNPSRIHNSFCPRLFLGDDCPRFIDSGPPSEVQQCLGHKAQCLFVRGAEWNEKLFRRTEASTRLPKSQVRHIYKIKAGAILVGYQASVDAFSIDPFEAKIPAPGSLLDIVNTKGHSHLPSLTAKSAESADQGV